MSSPSSNSSSSSSSSSLDRSLSLLSLGSTSSSVLTEESDDWDRTLGDVDSFAVPFEFETPEETLNETHNAMTPRNSVVFPAEEPTPGRTTRVGVRQDGGDHGRGIGKGKRTLSELLRLHSEKGKGSSGQFSPEEAMRIADVLGQWINASSSPYESENDDFQSFVGSRGQSQDDISISSKITNTVRILSSRPRGRSESANSLTLMSASGGSRPESSVGYIVS